MLINIFWGHEFFRASFFLTLTKPSPFPNLPVNHFGLNIRLWAVTTCATEELVFEFLHSLHGWMPFILILL